MDFLQSDFSAANAKNSGALKKLGKEVTGKLSNSQKDVVYKTMEKYKNSSNPLGKALGELDLNKKISSGTVNKIRQTTGVSLDRSAYRNQKNIPSVQNRSPYVSAPRQGIAPIKTSTSGPQLSQTFTKNTSAAMNSGLVVKR